MTKESLRITPLRTVAKVISGFAFKSTEFGESGIPVIKIKNIQLGDVDLTEIQYVADKYLSIDSKYHVNQGDILISLTGSHINQPNSVVGRVARYKNGFPKALINQRVGKVLIKRPEQCDAIFLYFQLFDEKIRRDIATFANGAANQANVSPSQIESLCVYLPSLSTQRKIAAILSAYDDLIENNLRRIKILEDMAQNLYREWFVKFRFPGHQQAHFIESAIGRIPEGWLGLFPDFVDFKEGPGLRKWQYRSEGLPFLNIRTLVDNDIDLSKVQYLDPKEVEVKYQHFLLKEYDHVVSSSGTLGRIVTIQKQHLPLMLNTSIIRMRPSTIRVARWQLKHFLSSDYFQNQILSFAIGAAQPNFGPSHLQQMLIVSPSDEIGLLYEETVEPLEVMIGTLVRKNTTLRRTRDLLLPKLISGDVDVSELDITISEEAV